MKKQFERTVSLAFQFSLVIACIVHNMSSSLSYFQYPTTIKAALKYPLHTENHFISICFPGQKENSKDSQYSNQTLDELLIQYPLMSKVIDYCSFRLEENDTFVEFNSFTECSKYFSIKTYILLGRLCFSFKKLSYFKFDFYELCTSPYNKGITFYISLSEFYANASSIVPVWHKYEVPYDDIIRTHAISLSPEYKELYQIGYTIFIYHRKKAPYDTRCVNYNKEGCMNECLLHAFHDRGIIPGSSYIPLPNSTFGSFFFKDLTSEEPEYKKCNLSCGANMCYEYFLITTISSYSVSNRSLVLAFGALTDLIARITYEEGYTLQDLIIQIGSVIGIWLGGSVSHLVSPISSLRGILTGRKSDEKLIVKVTKMFKKMTTLCQVRRRFFVKFPKEERPIVQKTGKVEVKLIARVLMVYDLLFRFLIITFFAFMASTALRNYFQYNTTIKHEKIQNPVSPFPNIAICTEFHNLIKILIPKYNMETFDSEVRKIDAQSNLTFDQLRNAVLPTKDLIDSCLLRNPKTLRAVWHDRFACNKFFDMSTFFTYNQLCYNLQNKLTTSHDLMHFGKLKDNPGTLYSIQLNPEFIRHSKGQFIILHMSTAGQPIRSRKFGIGVSYPYGSGFVCALNYYQIKFKYLSSPYDTNCLDKKGYDHLCFNECLMKKGQAINRLPYYALIDKPSNLTLLTYTDLANQIIANYWSRSESFCQKRCARILCTDQLINTIRSETKFSGIHPKYIIRNPSNPFLWTEFVPRIKFNDLLYNLSCCVSFWLGISVFSLNPVVLYYKRCERRLKNLLDHKLNFINRSLNSQIAWALSMIGKLTRINTADLKLQMHCTKVIPRLISIIKVGILFVGCTHHCYSTIQVYMKYPTLINTEIDINKTFFKHRMTFCVDIRDFIKTKPGEPHPNQRFTFKELDKLTPKIEELLSYCGYRPKESRIFSNVSSLAMRELMMFNYNVTECLENYETKKRFSSSYVCYNFKDKKEDGRTYGSLNSPNYRNFFGMNMSLNIRRLNPSISVNSDEHVKSMGSSFMWSNRLEQKPDMRSWYISSYDWYIQKTLPSPYDEGYYTSAAQTSCRALCLRTKLAQYNVFPTETVSIRNINSKLYHQSFNYPNIPKKKFLSDCEAYCKHSRFGLQHLNILVTRFVEVSLHTHSQNEWWIKRTTSPVFSMEYLPKYEMFGLLLEIGSIFAIWFGVSILGCNVFKKKEAHLPVRIRLLEEKLKQSRFLHYQLLKYFAISTRRQRTVNNGPPNRNVPQKSKPSTKPGKGRET